MKEVDDITIFKNIHRTKLEECRSVLYLFSKMVEEKKNHIRHPLYKYPLNMEKLDVSVAQYRINISKAVFSKYSEEIL